MALGWAPSSCGGPLTWRPRRDRPPSRRDDADHDLLVPAGRVDRDALERRSGRAGLRRRHARWSLRAGVALLPLVALVALLPLRASRPRLTGRSLRAGFSGRSLSASRTRRSLTTLFALLALRPGGATSTRRPRRTRGSRRAGRAYRTYGAGWPLRSTGRAGSALRSLGAGVSARTRVPTRTTLALGAWRPGSAMAIAVAAVAIGPDRCSYKQHREQNSQDGRSHLSSTAAQYPTNPHTSIMQATTTKYTSGLIGLPCSGSPTATADSA